MSLSCGSLINTHTRTHARTHAHTYAHTHIHTQGWTMRAFTDWVESSPKSKTSSQDTTKVDSNWSWMLTALYTSMHASAVYMCACTVHVLVYMYLDCMCTWWYRYLYMYMYITVHSTLSFTADTSVYVPCNFEIALCRIESTKVHNSCTKHCAICKLLPAHGAGHNCVHKRDKRTIAIFSGLLLRLKNRREGWRLATCWMPYILHLVLLHDLSSALAPYCTLASYCF